MSALRVTEIFHSLQGEARPAGYPTAFIRLTGCPLRCVYCDTSHAFQGGNRLDIAEKLERVAAFSVRHVCVTGGEPLAQPACIELLGALCDSGYTVSLETSGALDISAVDSRVMVVLDIKTPDSGECGRNLWANISRLKREDQVKFVICSRADYDWSRSVLAERRLEQLCEVLFSPSWGQLPARDLAEWVLADRLPVRFQLQLHKYLWGDAPGH
ncbi:MAG: 7-carboxy-7-deazaguanine synthase QueE [Gammaproteobacteria bacterium]|nr:7-carboxy-7-deazaguanine synthase QueE [Gammaproteobacteria bacterium]